MSKTMASLLWLMSRRNTDMKWMRMININTIMIRMIMIMRILLRRDLDPYQRLMMSRSRIRLKNHPREVELGGSNLLISLTLKAVAKVAKNIRLNLNEIIRKAV